MSRLARMVSLADDRLSREAANLGPDQWLRSLAHLSNAANHAKLWIGLAGVLARFGGRRGRRAAQRGLLATAASSILVNGALKPLFPRPRPPARPHTQSLVRRPLSSSFPSGHAASAAAFATATAMEAPAAAAPVAALAAGVAYSRVSTGVHYPSDVIAGAAIGVAIAAATTRLWPLIDPAPATAPPAPQRYHNSTLSVTGDGLIIVANDNSGSHAHDELAAEIASKLPGAQIWTVEDPSQLLDQLNAAAEAAEVLGVIGGDGSVSAAAAVALDHDLPLAVFPGGTLNHFARDIGVDSATDTIAAITAGNLVEVDAATIDDRVFLNTASFGTYSAFVTARKRLEPRLGKWAAMAVALVEVLRTATPFEVELDGHPHTVWMAFIGNCAYDPPGFAPATRKRLDDGKLDIRLVDAATPAARMRLVGAVLAGQLAESRVYIRYLTSSVTVTTKQHKPTLAADGETFTGHGSFTVAKHATPLRVYAARESAEHSEAFHEFGQ